MKKIIKACYFVIPFLLLSMTVLYAQLEGLHGDIAEFRDGLHAGNQFRTTFYNDGTFGRVNNPPDIAGEWPINSGHWYMIDGNVFVGSEVLDTENNLKHIVSTVKSAGDGSPEAWSSGDTGPNGEWWTFLPLPGFASNDTNKIAMSKWKWAWPDYWPDKHDDVVDPGWRGKWNGYFGKDIFNADEESYFVADDYNNQEFKFYPDSTDSLRGGLGLRLYVRGFQWSNALVEDALFALFDLENIGTFEHDKMVFGYKFGNNMGDAGSSYDGSDDMGAYDKAEDVAYLYDYDDIGAGSWFPVGYFGGAFLESPGNVFDGIDNDGDAGAGNGNVISSSMFTAKTLTPTDDIVLIDYVTFERTVQKMGNDTINVYYQDLVFKFWPGKTIEEVPNNLVDDNLNGLIDENNGSTYGETTVYLYDGVKYINYLTGEGADNPLIDEKRDDGIDNDNDWNPLTDDVGLDGVENTGDTGEADGVPSSGRGTDLPGEPHIDKTDIDETDMLGLTSFTLYVWEDIPHYEDEKVWDAIVPGNFDALMENANIELLYGSGYFPMKPGQIERFSMGIICGISLDDFLENKKWVAKAYHENYNFSKAPLVPNVTAIPGDGKITLYWDSMAEDSYDPISGYDFEGYRIYRSTDPGFNDMIPITDGKGSVTYRKPLAQFDVANEYSGYAAVPIKGVHFYLGDNTGIRNSWTDTTAVNGQKYFYAVTSYDHGFPEGNIAPSECSKFISISTAGEIDKGNNVVIARAEAPSAGFIPANIDSVKQVSGATTSLVGYEIIDPHLIEDNHTYRITFEDTLILPRSGTSDYKTKNFNLIDVTDAVAPDTLLASSTAFGDDDVIPMTAGFKIQLANQDGITVNTDASAWSRSGIYDFLFEPFKYSTIHGIPEPADYRIEFGEAGIDTSTYYKAKSRRYNESPVNFRVYNVTAGKYIDFSFWERDGDDGIFSAFTDGSATDHIIFLDDSLEATWDFELDPATNDSLHVNPAAGDILEIRLNKPFLSHDVFEFTTHGQGIDKDLAKQQMDRIKVVPNPYVVANSWEPLNPYSTGRGPRELHFTHLPAQCTIKIFTIRGQLVRELNHDTPEFSDGTEIWDMQTKDLLDISYGVYIYYIDAGELGEKVGKFAVVK